MQEFTAPGEVAISDEQSLARIVFEAADAYPDRPSLATMQDGVFVDMTAKELRDRIVGVAKGLLACGVEVGDRVAIMAPTCVEWTILDFAIWTAGGVTVPIYETSSTDQVEWIVTDADVKILVVGSEELAATCKAPFEAHDTATEMFVLDAGGLEDLVKRGADVSDADVHARWQETTTSDVATIVYTSGTTGRPKGCVITHGNFVWDATQVAYSGRTYFRPGKSTLLFLPLAHIFARVMQVACVQAGVRMGYATDVTQLVEELGVFKPDFLVAVPRVFEKVYNAAKQKAHDAGKGKIFDAADHTAVEYSKAREAGKVPVALALKHKLFDALVYSKIRARLGGRVQHAVSGGAALGDRLGHFFTGIGVMILEGYGLTETTAGACLNTPQFKRIGTVGRPVPGASVRIDSDGEILLKGGHVFQGYYNNPDATAEALDADGWYRTGDLGALDNDGYLRITGRKKEIIVTAGGKNVAPAVLEDAIRAHPLVSQAVALGDGEPFIAALVTIDPEAFESWKTRNDVTAGTVADAVDNDVLRAAVQEAVNAANETVSRAESIREFRILPNDFEVGDELSQKQSIKRHVVAEKYADVIQAIYGE